MKATKHNSQRKWVKTFYQSKICVRCKLSIRNAINHLNVIVVHSIKVFVHFQNNLPTFIDYFSEQVLCSREGSRRAVPTLIAKLMLALMNRVIGTFMQSHQKTWVFSGQTTLLSSQVTMNWWRIHVQNSRRYRRQIVRLTGFCKAPEN